MNTIEENINQNVNTRSHILAPFNSSGNHEKSYSLEIKNENEIFKFCGKAKEANRNYELNNNCEIDNGIIIAKDVIKDVKIVNEEKSINFENNEVDSNIPTPKEETHRHSKNLRESLLKTNSNTYVLGK